MYAVNIPINILLQTQAVSVKQGFTEKGTQLHKYTTK